MSNEKGYTKKEMMKVLQILEDFRKVYPDMQMQTAVVFVNVVLNEGTTMKSIQERTGVVQATVSRNISLLSEDVNIARGRKGFGLVYTQEDPAERRRKIVFLTAKGKHLASSLCLNLRSLED